MKRVFFVLLMFISVFFIYSESGKINKNSEDKVEIPANVNDTNNVLTLEIAIKNAMEKNPDILAQKISLENAIREKNSTWNNFLPNISVTGGLTFPHPDTNMNWSLSGGIDLTLSANIPAKMKQSALNYEIAFIKYQNTETNIRNTVIQTYYALLAEKQNIEILKYSMELAEKSYNQVLQNYNRGLASELDMLNARYAYQSMKPSLESAVSSFNYNLSNFAVLIGYEELIYNIDETLEIPVKKLVLPEGKELCQEYLSNRYDVIAKKLDVKNAELALSNQKLSSYVPSISLSETVRPTTNASDDFSIQGSFSVSTRIPLSSYIPGSQTSNSVKSKEGAVESAKISYEETVKNSRNDIGKKAAEVNRLWNAIPVAEMNWSIATRSHELSNEGYNAGLVSRTDFDNARQKMTKAEQSVLSAKLEYFKAVNNLALSLQITVDELYEKYEVK